MAQIEGGIEIKFRLFDGTDIAHGTYASSTTVDALKHRILADFPQDKSFVPESINEIKIIHAGKFLENYKTLAESQVFSGGGIITMHVVLQPPVIDSSVTFMEIGAKLRTSDPPRPRSAGAFRLPKIITRRGNRNRNHALAASFDLETDSSALRFAFSF